MVFDFHFPFFLYRQLIIFDVSIAEIVFVLFFFDKISPINFWRIFNHMIISQGYFLSIFDITFIYFSYLKDIVR